MLCPTVRVDTHAYARAPILTTDARTSPPFKSRSRKYSYSKATDVTLKKKIIFDLIIIQMDYINGDTYCLYKPDI